MAWQVGQPLFDCGIRVFAIGTEKEGTLLTKFERSTVGGTIQAGTLKITGAVLDVRANLRLEAVVDLGTMKRLSGKKMNVGQLLHISSGRAARAEAIAAARRFHPLVSSRRRLRPRDVSS